MAADTTPPALAGCVFCKFNLNGNADMAYCYFKQIDGEIRDEFFLNLRSQVPKTKKDQNETTSVTNSGSSEDLNLAVSNNYGEL